MGEFYGKKLIHDLCGKRGQEKLSTPKLLRTLARNESTLSANHGYQLFIDLESKFQESRWHVTAKHDGDLITCSIAHSFLLAMKSTTVWMVNYSYNLIEAATKIKNIDDIVAAAKASRQDRICGFSLPQRKWIMFLLKHEKKKNEVRLEHIGFTLPYLETKEYSLSQQQRCMDRVSAYLSVWAFKEEA